MAKAEAATTINESDTVSGSAKITERANPMVDYGGVEEESDSG